MTGVWPCLWVHQSHEFTSNDLDLDLDLDVDMDDFNVLACLEDHFGDESRQEGVSQTAFLS